MAMWTRSPFHGLRSETEADSIYDSGKSFLDTYVQLSAMSIRPNHVSSIRILVD